jgi:hypothetical protein
MGALIKVREYANPAEILAHARELHRKTWQGNARFAIERQAERQAAAERLAEADRRREEERAAERERVRLELALAHGGALALYEQTIGKERLERGPRVIIERIAKHHGVTAAEITGHGRRAHVMHARFAALAAVREANPLMSTPKIASYFGGRDHTTVLSALKRADLLGAEALSIPKPPAKLETRPQRMKAAKP